MVIKIKKFQIRIFSFEEQYIKRIRNLLVKNKVYHFGFISILIIILLSLNKVFDSKKDIKIIEKKDELIQGIKYMEKCFEEKEVKIHQAIFYKNPKISCVIPAYNCQNVIKAVIRSIQYQTMQDIEIILVNDNSNDNTSLVIKELAKVDSRIKVLNNEKTMATLYSRNIGILLSKGKYILNLDNDDLFFNDNLFDIIYNEAERGNLDLVGFAAIESSTYNPTKSGLRISGYHIHKDGLMVFQPELTYFTILGKDHHVWGRLTNGKIYKKAINNFGKNALGEKRNLCFVTWGEDSAISVVIHRYASSYKFIKIFGIFHHMAKTSSSETTKKYLKKYGDLFYLDTLFDFSHETIKGKKYVIRLAKSLIFRKIKHLYNEKNVRFLKSILQKIIDCKFISSKTKIEIKKKYNLKKKYLIFNGKM